MIIPLLVRRRFDQLMPYGLISIKARRVRPIPIEVLIDTGSPWIAITPKDIVRLGISISALKKAPQYPEVALAGDKFWRFLLEDATIHMRDERGGLVSVNMHTISVLWPTRKKPPEETKHVPSVLGSDFLTIGKFHLHFNPSKGIAFLEKENSEQGRQ